MAQVRVDPGALGQLEQSAPAPAAPTARTTARPATRTPPHRRPAPRKVPHPPAHPAVSRPAAPASPAQAKPRPAPRPATPPATQPATLAPAPPPAVVLPPVLQPPTPPPAPALPVPVLPDAAGEATKLPNGIRITFAPGKADLNPATAAALQALARAVKGDPNVDLNLYAYAAGAPDDPSTPRRLSLSRALNVRAVLINEGIVSTRIYPRALGATPSDGPADRVDVTNGPPPAPPAQ